jgi:DNA-binding NtrC family response regulator
MNRVLVSWIGRTDLRAVTDSAAVGDGPIAQAVRARAFDVVALLTNDDETAVAPFIRWLQAKTSARIEVEHVALPSPTAFGSIHVSASTLLTRLRDDSRGELKLTYHLSPGTPAMASIWIILAKTRFPAELIESSREHGVKTVEFPFDLSAEFLPDLLRQRDERLRERSAAEAPTDAAFADIVHRSPVMVRLVQRARRVAGFNVPTLLEGESGTGKELLARAIHRASERSAKEFVAVNCGAIPEALVEATLFGHARGAFTDAKEARRGVFEAASGGTLFLDEVGELPLSVQVKLLRVLQENEITRVGETKPVKVDVRIITATHRNLVDEVAAGRFREDLFYRFAVAVLKVPALRDRAGDVGLIVDHVLASAQREMGEERKRLSPSARNLLLSHPWPGNVRELANTIRRLLIWTEGSTIGVEDVRDALLPSGRSRPAGVLGKALGDGFSLPDTLDEVARHYLARAMNEAHGNKTKAAELLGLASYQTLSNWLVRHNVSVGTERA